ncbi:hypothetical protein EDB83DRAFT_2312502 [Lactarius deliciosus]|nr:hypothetical protein EDB83DRAFT_2312502 [Lactarius deliciosus]
MDGREGGGWKGDVRSRLEWDGVGEVKDSDGGAEGGGGGGGGVGRGGGGWGAEGMAAERVYDGEGGLICDVMKRTIRKRLVDGGSKVGRGEVRNEEDPRLPTQPGTGGGIPREKAIWCLSTSKGRGHGEAPWHSNRRRATVFRLGGVHLEQAVLSRHVTSDKPGRFQVFTLRMSSRPSKSITFANFFSDDTATDLSIYYPSMHDHLQGLAVAATLLPRRKLKRLLILSMLMTLGMALLSVYSTHILSRLGLVALWQHYDDVTNSLLVQISTQLLAAGLIDNSTMIPFPRPPQSCKLNTPLCNISLPWLYGSVISLSSLTTDSSVAYLLRYSLFKLEYTCPCRARRDIEDDLSALPSSAGAVVRTTSARFARPVDCAVPPGAYGPDPPRSAQLQPLSAIQFVTGPRPVYRRVVVSSLRHLANIDPEGVNIHIPPRVMDACRTLPRSARARASALLVETRTVAPVLAMLSWRDAPLPIFVAVAGCPHTHSLSVAGAEIQGLHGRGYTSGPGTGHLLGTRTAGDRASSRARVSGGLEI